MGGEDGCEGRVELLSGLITVKFVNSVGQRMLHLSGKSQGKVREFKKSVAVATMLLHYCFNLASIVTSSALIPLW